MNTKSILVVVVMLTSHVFGQGTMFVYDQQSSVDGSYLEGGANIQDSQLFGQSFTPQLSSVGFIRLYIYNGFLGNETAANIVVNLRSDSLSGAILGTSSVVTIPSGAFAGLVDFTFAVPLSVTPGTTYYFQPVVQNNNNLGLLQAGYGYAGGTEIFKGVADPNKDLWFREGVIVPEPSSVALLLIGAGVFLRLNQRKRANSSAFAGK